jgi:hypothetical protein
MTNQKETKPTNPANINELDGVKFTRPVSMRLANNLVGLKAAIEELNAKRLSFADASSLLGVHINTLMNYCDDLGIAWAMKKTYKPRRKPSAQ